MYLQQHHHHQQTTTTTAKTSSTTTSSTSTATTTPATTITITYNILHRLRIDLADVGARVLLNDAGDEEVHVALLCLDGVPVRLDHLLAVHRKYGAGIKPNPRNLTKKN